MKPQPLIAGMAVLLAAGAALADTGGPERELVGRVGASYVRLAPGVFVQHDRAAGSRNAPRWVEVEPASGGTPVMAAEPEGERLQAGTEVMVRIAGRQTKAFPVPEVSRVVEVRAVPAPTFASQLAGRASLMSSQ